MAFVLSVNCSLVSYAIYNELDESQVRNYRFLDILLLHHFFILEIVAIHLSEAIISYRCSGWKLLVLGAHILIGQNYNQIIIRKKTRALMFQPVSRPHLSQNHAEEQLPYRYPKIAHYQVGSPKQETEWLAYWKWRQETSMPVVKVVKYSRQCSDENGVATGAAANVYTVQFESELKRIDQITIINCSEGIYLVKQYLIGIQALLLKFNLSLEPCLTSCCVNSKGQPKIWINDIFSSKAPKNSPFTNHTRSYSPSSHPECDSIARITQFLLNTIGNCIKLADRRVFNQIVDQILAKPVVSFAEVQNEILTISEKYKLKIPRRLDLTRGKQTRRQSIARSIKSKCSVGAPSSTLLRSKKLRNPSIVDGLKNCQTNDLQRILKCKQLRLRPFFAPTNKEHASLNKKRPVVNWFYAGQKLVQNSLGMHPKNSGQKVANLPNRHSITSRRPCTANDFYSCKPGQSRLVSKLSKLRRQAKSSSPQAHRKKDYLNQLYPSQINQQQLDSIKSSFDHKKIERGRQLYGTCSSEPQDFRHKMGASISGMGNSCNSKQSMATTQFSLSQRTGSSFQEPLLNRTKPAEMFDHSKPIVNSITMNTRPGSGWGETGHSRAYDFGGLIPAVSSKAHNAEICCNHGGRFETSVGKSDDNSSLFNANMHFPNGLLLMDKLFNQEAEDLKQSVWCGEDRKAPHLEIKLDKLGKMGRQICESFMPSD